MCEPFAGANCMQFGGGCAKVYLVDQEHCSVDPKWDFYYESSSDRK